MKKYRLNAGIVVFRNDGKVLLCERVEKYKNNWQFPQGGIDEGESPEQAAFRELKEETSVVSVQKFAEYPESLKYDFPEYVKAKNFKHGIFSDGQEQFWFLFLFKGEDNEINLATKEREFISYKWVDIQDAPDMVVDFKKEVYVKVVGYFSQKIEEYVALK